MFSISYNKTRPMETKKCFVELSDHREFPFDLHLPWEVEINIYPGHSLHWMYYEGNLGESSVQNISWIRQSLQ